MSIPSLPAQGSTAWYPWAQALHTAASSAVQASDMGSGNSNDLALRAALVSPLPTAGSFAYNGDGTIASDPDGNTYTWNTDGTPATQTKGGVTRTFHWNTDGTLASVS